MNLARSSIALSLLASAGASLAVSHAHAQGLSERIRAVADQRAQERAQDTSKAAMLGALLYTDVSVNFDKTPARTAFEYVADQIGVSLIVRYEGEGGAGGIDPELEISMQLDGAPALTVLERLLEMCAVDDPCTWQLRDGFVEAGTKDRLSVPAARELRMYPIRDLLFEPPYFDNAPDFNLSAAIEQGGQQGGQGGGGGGFGGGGGGIIGDVGEDPERMSEDERAEQLQEIIEEQCEPEAWTDGTATMRYYQGVLIIRAPDYIHRQIDGYPFAPRRPARAKVSSAADGAPGVIARRYVTFTSAVSIVDNVRLRGVPVNGAVGNGGTTGGSAGSPILKDSHTTPPAPPAPGVPGRGDDGKPAAPKP